MRFKATIFLSLVLVLLGGYLFYVELPGEKKKQEAEVMQKRLYSFSPSAITNLTIQSANGASIDFLHEPADPDNPWRITHPVEALANDAAASALASQLERLESTRLVEEKSEDLKEFGLDPPAYMVIITLHRTDTEILEVGSENLTGNEVYVRKGAGTPVYLVPVSIKKSLNKDLAGWRRQELFHFASTDVKRVRIDSPRQQIEIAREGDDWRIKKPIQAKGDPTEISNLLGSLSGLRGEDFIDVNKEDWKKGFGSPILKLNLLVGGLEREALFYKAPLNPESVYAVTTPLAPIYKLSGEAFKILEEPASVYRDRRLVDLTDPSQVEQIAIRRGREPMLLEKKEGEWWIKKGAVPKKVDGSLVNALLFELNELRVDRFPEPPLPAPAKVGLSDGLENGTATGPAWSIQLKGKEGKSLSEISFGRAEGSQVYAQSTHQSGPVLLKQEEVDRVQRAREEIKPAETPAPPATPPSGSTAPKG
ncbi:MAG: DUF4340 domain-containing protein [Candidatus Manganitrophaceae bacterium]|nr:MAG: DUF4340 domain-containing protein [Candidatus Manganitrophaceae bacterium]